MENYPCGDCTMMYHSSDNPCFWNENCNKYKEWLNNQKKEKNKEEKELFNYEVLLETLRRGDDAKQIADNFAETLNKANAEIKREQAKNRIKDMRTNALWLIVCDFYDYLTEYYPDEYEDGLFNFFNELTADNCYYMVNTFVETLKSFNTNKLEMDEYIRKLRESLSNDNKA